MIEKFVLDEHTEGEEGHALSNDTERQEKQLRELQRLADTDGLTGVLNRRSFDNNMKTAFDSTTNRPISVVTADIDYFKQLNDRYGHSVGDRVLQDFAEILKSKSRNETAYIGRMGGEEFAIGLIGVNADTAYGIAEAIRKEVEQYQTSLGEKVVKITVSCGVAERRKNESYPELMIRADAGLYEAKRGQDEAGKGRNQVASAK